MPFLQLRDSRYPLTPGDAKVGCGQNVDVRLPATATLPAGAASASTLAIISVSEDGSATVRRSSGSVLSLNGVPVGDEPAPLLHGDRIGFDGCEVNFADESFLGDTLDFPLAADSDTPASAPSSAGPSTGGRLLSLVDGREYTVGERGLSIGRDAACDIVIPANEVSRRHAEIRGSATGYALLDRSTNGVLVNGRRVWAEVALSRGDMIRIGREEYRFYAEPVSARAGVSAPATRVAEAPRGQPAPPAASAPRTASGLAALEIINEGPAKGTRLEIFAPVANIGRGAHNDVVIQDESVSEFHAKMQRRDESWFLSDMGSTNGTYLNGERLVDEARIGPGAELRFGGVKTLFRPKLGAGKGADQTRVIVGIKAPEPKRLEPAGAPSLPAASAKRERPSRDMPVFLFILLAGLVAYVVYLLTRGGESPAGVGLARIWS